MTLHLPNAWVSVSEEVVIRGVLIKIEMLLLSHCNEFNLYGPKQS